MFLMRADTLGGEVGGWGWRWKSRVLRIKNTAYQCSGSVTFCGCAPITKSSVSFRVRILAQESMHENSYGSSFLAAHALFLCAWWPVIFFPEYTVVSWIAHKRIRP
jgi:hypothetical protein